MNVSVIISVYKDIEALSLIIESLLNQTHPVNEIIISEDGNCIEVTNYYHRLNMKQVKHSYQDDLGWRKNKALNQSINLSKNDYLIFIDGDCIPYPTFIESHVVLSEKNFVLCGRRTEPGWGVSKLLRSKELSVGSFVKKYFLHFYLLHNDNIRHYQQGIYFSPRSYIFRFIGLARRKDNHLIGCNFSCWKSDLKKINGFDEDYTLPTTGEDTDVERRLRHFNVKMKSCRYSANVIHLYHKKGFDKAITDKTEALMKSKEKSYVCLHGLIKKVSNYYLPNNKFIRY